MRYSHIGMTVKELEEKYGKDFNSSTHQLYKDGIYYQLAIDDGIVTDVWFIEEKKSMTKYEKYKKAESFLRKYIEDHNLKSVLDLFDKETLFINSSDTDFDWAVEDGMKQGLTEEQAIEEARKWFMEMSKYELFYSRTNSFTQQQMIIDKAEELGFEMED